MQSTAHTSRFVSANYLHQGSALRYATMARNQLGWAPRIDFRLPVKEMALEDLKSAERDALVARHAYGVRRLRVVTAERVR